MKKLAALKAGEYCPFVDSPWNECFVVGTDSVSTEKAIYYCGRNFGECEIYSRRIKGKPS